MARRRQIYLVKTGGASGATAGSSSHARAHGAPAADTLTPLGSLKDLAKIMSGYNTSPDGSGPHGFGERLGTGVFFGPGMVLEVPLMEEPDAHRGQGPDIRQILVSVTDEDFAFPVLMRLCKLSGWQMMDPESGRTFG